MVNYWILLSCRDLVNTMIQLGNRFVISPICSKLGIQIAFMMTISGWDLIFWRRIN